MIDSLIKIVRWPENKRTGTVPWFVIVRRLVFWPIMTVGLFVAFIGIFCAFGSKEGIRFWNDEIW